jgi:glycosyltransferase involved in cell wall biosynthesis
MLNNIIKVALLSETYNKNYFRALEYLEINGVINLTSYSWYILPEIIKYVHNLKISILNNNNNNNNSNSTSFINKTINFLTNQQHDCDILLHPIRLVKLIKADVIVLACSPYHPYIYLVSLLSLINKKIIFSTSWPYWQYQKYPYKGNKLSRILWKHFLYNRQTHTVTRKAALEIEKIGAKVNIIPHSVDLNIFKPHKTKHYPLRILYVGRLEEEKGIKYLTKAVSKIDIPYELWIVGNGSLKEYLYNQRNIYNIRLFEYISDTKKLASIFQKCDIFVLPSYATSDWEELFGISIIEAMASKLPVITTNQTGPKEIIKNDLNGLIIKQKSVNSLNRSILKLLHNSKLRKRLAECAYKNVKQKYSIVHCSNEWHNLIKNII